MAVQKFYNILKTFQEPIIKPNEVLVKLEATQSLIHSVDLHIRKGYPGLKLNFPHILGADISSIVWETGSEVKNFQKGDRVVAYPIVLSENLEPKFLGYEHLNDGWKYFGMHIPGSYCEFVAVPAKNIVHISPETTSPRLLRFLSPD
jgi:Zn-dependent alcohol dehydrogenases